MFWWLTMLLTGGNTVNLIFNFFSFCNVSHFFILANFQNTTKKLCREPSQTGFRTNLWLYMEMKGLERFFIQKHWILIFIFNENRTNSRKDIWICVFRELHQLCCYLQNCAFLKTISLLFSSKILDVGDVAAAEKVFNFTCKYHIFSFLWFKLHYHL